MLRRELIFLCLVAPVYNICSSSKGRVLFSFWLKNTTPLALVSISSFFLNEGKESREKYWSYGSEWALVTGSRWRNVPFGITSSKVNLLADGHCFKILFVTSTVSFEALDN